MGFECIIVHGVNRRHYVNKKILQCETLLKCCATSELEQQVKGELCDRAHAADLPLPSGAPLTNIRKPNDDNAQ